MIRRARIAELHQLLEMAGAMHAESGYRDLPFCAARAFRELHDWLMRGDAAVIVYETRDGVLAGFVIGEVGAHWFSAERGVWDRLFYVRPEYRHGIIAARLYEGLRDFARERGATDLWPGVSTGSAEACAFYTRLGLEPIGTVFRDRL